MVISEHELDLFLVTRDYEGRGEGNLYRCYIIKNTSPEYSFVQSEIPPPHNYDGASYLSSMDFYVTVFGGKVYPSGPFVNMVYRMNLENPDKGWKNMVEGIAALREGAYVFAHGPSIYIVGGHRRESDDPISFSRAAVYSYIYGWWFDLPPVPDDWPDFHVKGHIVLGNKILLYSDLADRPIFYDIELKAWGFHDSFGSIPNSFAFVDGIIYHVHDGYKNSIVAYDVNMPLSESEDVSLSWTKSQYDEQYDTGGPSGLLPGCTFVGGEEYRPKHIVLSLGEEEIAVVWAHERYHVEHGTYLSIHCSKFNVFKSENNMGKLQIKAKLIRTSVHYVRGRFLQCCSTVFGSEVIDPTINTRIWTNEDDMQLLKALHSLQSSGTYIVGSEFKPELIRHVESVLGEIHPNARLKSHAIGSRIETLKAKTEIVHDMLHGTLSNGFDYKDFTKRVTAVNSVWEDYFQRYGRPAESFNIKKPFPLYKELSEIFGIKDVDAHVQKKFKDDDDDDDSDYDDDDDSTMGNIW